VALKRRSFAHSIAWNLAGAGVPLVLAIYAIPRLLAGYGDARFGFLTIVWTLIGYFSIFDLGLGRALTRHVADKIGRDLHEQIPAVAATALACIGALGLLTALLLFGLASWIVETFLSLDAQLTPEAVLAVRVMAISIPMVVLSSALIGLLEAFGKFKEINIVRLVMGIMNFGAPLAVLHWSNSLVPATLSLVVTRMITSMVYWRLASRSSGGSLLLMPLRVHARSLLGYGGWITISNLVSPIMAQLDKVLIGAILTVAILPIYSVPGDMVNRLSFLPVAMVSVLFPAFAKIWAVDPRAGGALYSDASHALLAGVLPVALMISAVAPEGMNAWMGVAFGEQSSSLLRWLAVGFLLNAIARVPHALLQSVGRPDITAKLHLFELPIFLGALWACLHHFGILGAAIAWTLRMGLDLLLLQAAVCLVDQTMRARVMRVLWLVAGATSITAIATLIGPLWVRILLSLVAAALCLPIALRTLLSLKHA